MGNTLVERKLKAAFSAFPAVARQLIETAQSQVPATAARRAELVDTTGDGNVDSLAVDTVGDGVVDTMIQLSELGKSNSPGKRGGSGGTYNARATVCGSAAESVPSSRTAGAPGAAEIVSVVAKTLEKSPRLDATAGTELELSEESSRGQPRLWTRRSQAEQEDDRSDFMSKAMDMFGFHKL